jgi:hypothetical protein
MTVKEKRALYRRFEKSMLEYKKIHCNFNSSDPADYWLSHGISLGIHISLEVLVEEILKVKVNKEDS